MTHLTNPIVHLKDNYGKTDKVVTFLAPRKIYRYYEGKLKMKDIMGVLSQSESYTLLKNEKPRRIFNNTITYKSRDLVQGDLFYVDKLSQENKGVKYILSVLDCHTRYAFCETLTNRSCEAVRHALERIFLRMNPVPRIFCSDRGAEFKCKATKQFLQKLKIKTFYAMGSAKASMVERFQRTFQRIIYKYLVENETYTFVDKLQLLLKQYNITYHNSIGMTPSQAEKPKNWNVLSSNLSKSRSRTRVKKIMPRFVKGDIVRISMLKGPYSRSYDIQNTHARYIVEAVNTARVVPYYTLKNEQGEVLTGKFYGSEITLTNIETYRGQVLKSRLKKNGKTENLMRFTGYSPEYDMWLASTNIKKIIKK